ncbi:MAG: trypsin-like peptidase domain-containing protein, partial [Acidobacteria bacterium]|nr:trypsin-like peptidase domain-containing protein [Acidobacteriota bacterium]
MSNRRLLYLTLLIATLTIGVVIGTIVSGGVKATAEQKAATLVIPDPVSLSNAFSQIASQLEPAVVNITVEGAVQTTRRSGRNIPTDPFDFFDFFGAPDSQGRREPRVVSEGSGFIVDKAGYILTNQHVVDNAKKITVRLDNKSEHVAKLIGSDEETDLAVIKIDAGGDLPFAKLGNSDSVKVGDWVLALGSPFGLDHTVTSGIISAKGRESREISPGTNRQFQNFLQTDAAINRGNSGGPLVNMAGEVIGVNTAILSSTGTFAGLGFALPSNTAIRVYNQLVQNGKVTRGAIGIQYRENDPVLKRAMGIKDGGVVVQSVESNGPAAKAGLHAGDIILEIDGKKITDGNVLLDIVANSPVGKSVQMKINREGREMTVPVVIEDRAVVVPSASSGSRPDRQQPDETTQGKLGIRVQDITPDMMRQLRLDSENGVYIASVEPDSVAEDSGLAEGMIITAVRIEGGPRMPIGNIDDFRNAEKLMKSGSAVA